MLIRQAALSFLLSSSFSGSHLVSLNSDYDEKGLIAVTAYINVDEDVGTQVFDWLLAISGLRYAYCFHRLRCQILTE